MSSTTGVLKKNRGKILIAIAALLIALVAVVGSGAYFTSVSSNPGNVFTAGILTHGNSADGTFFMTLSDIVPDNAVEHTGSVMITNTGTVAADVSLSQTAFTDVRGWGDDPAAGALSDTLLVTIEDSAGNVIYGPGLIRDMGANLDAGSIGAGLSETYDWTVVFPDNGQPGGAMDDDNAYQGAEVTVDYAWELVSQ